MVLTRCMGFLQVCGDFIDTPVKRYSSGMFVKLAFAVAAHLDSEIMVMDEVLAVGDMKFQQKCLGKMSDVAGQEGRTVLYVSHNMSTIRQLCTRCVVLDQGRVIFDGDVEQAIAVYMETTDVNVVHYDLLDVSRMNASAGKRMRLETLDFVGKESSVFADTEKIRVRITWRVSEPFAGVHLKLNLHFRDSTPVGITHPVSLGAAVPGKLYTTEFEFDPSLLGEGQYFFYVDVFDGVLTQAVCLDKPVTEFAFEVTSGDLTMPEWAPAGAASTSRRSKCWRMDTMGDIFICHTLYHVLIALVRALRSRPGKSTLVLSTCVPEAETLRAKLLDAAPDLWDAVLIVDEEKLDAQNSESDFYRLRHPFRKPYFTLPKGHVYISNDWSALGRYLQRERRVYTLCEDTFGGTLDPDQHLLDEQRTNPRPLPLLGRQPLLPHGGSEDAARCSIFGVDKYTVENKCFRVLGYDI